ncbi:CDP-alcohol phosphatidyltransferase family protein [Haloplanus halophilus]|uniref:CDP-alcohol phosphatidyltransferase family protein n=1 Tax=Haloplanus halophilus TaxID=2949993 RepID=UPI00203C8E3B|nr:CDP-alcohol phosphatidyltransferase family protein [Haloplanus sp. GDY1]
MSGRNVRERRLGAAAVTATAVAAAGVAVGGWTLVADATTRAAANRWTLVTGAVLAYEVGFLAYHVDADRPGAAAAPPNLVTLARGLLYAATAGFLVVPPSAPAVRWAPAVCYGTGVALDFADGRLARRTGRTTPLGERLDHAFDTLGFLVAPLVGVAWGRLPLAYLSLSAARYVYRAGVGWRRRRERPVADLPASRVRRPLAALQMGFITVALAPALPASLVHPASLVVVAPSLAVFARDYLAVTGRLGGRIGRRGDG